MSVATLLNRPPVIADSEKNGRIIRLSEGESTTIPGTQTIIAIKSVMDRTSSGCLGGAIGCRDRVTIEVRNGKETEEVVLAIANTAVQRQQKIDQTVIEGKTVRLTEINKKEVKLVVESSTSQKIPEP